MAQQLEEAHNWNLNYGPDVHNEKIPGALDLGFSYSEERDELQVAKIPQKDRATHLYVVGATGTGKTKFLEFLIRQDITCGHGFGVIDPHGDLTEDIKGFLAYRYLCEEDVAEITQRVVLIDPTDPECTVTFNPLEAIPGVSVAEQAAELVSSFKKIWSDSWGVRMEDLMRNTLIALGEAELTLCELTPFLTRRAFRDVVLEKVTNPTTQDYFRRFDTMTDRAQITWIEPVMNKINAFMADDRMRQMFSSPKSSIDLREIMDNRKYLLIKLDKGKLKGSADLLGSLFMAKIQMTAFSRSGIPQRQRVPFYLYIDEFQNFATESFEVILSEARKYGLSLVMAHQSLSQIPDDLRGLILASAGVQVYFRVNRTDANLLAKEVFKYSGFEVKSEGVNRPVYWSFAEEWEHKISDLQHLPPRTCYAKHKIDGGYLELHTVDIQTGWEMIDVDEEDYLDYVKKLPFGFCCLEPREELAIQAQERQQFIEQAVKAKAPAVVEPSVEIRPIAVPVETPKIQVVAPPTAEVIPVGSVEIKAPEKDDPAEEREHRRLQHLIKRLAQQSGYKATIEQPTSDGKGRVDVSLERDDASIACEVSVTTSPEHELANIQKCLASGYDKVIFCSPTKKTLEKTRALCSKKLSESDMERVSFLEPDGFVLQLEEEAARNAGKTERINGYKVKVKYQPLTETDKSMKRQTIAQVVLQSLRREK